MPIPLAPNPYGNIYTWLTFAQAKSQLAQRLADTSNRFWTDVECGIYIIEALREWNALTNTWSTEYTFNAPIVADQVWYDLSSLVASPRSRTVTDSEMFTLMRYHLLEPPVGDMTGQFTQDDFTQALQRRRDELIQASACNMANIQIASAPNQRSVFLADTNFEVTRVRFVDVAGNANTLYREDNLAFEYYQPGYLQAPSDVPNAYDIVTSPPLSLDVDVPPAQAGRYDMVVLQSGTVLAPPTNTVLGLPDDFCWVAKWGALADLLGRESEATDRQRADFCLKRYMDGMKLLSKSSWMLLGQIQGVPVDTPSLAEMDQYAPEWDSDPTAVESIVTCGIDFFAVSPVPDDVNNPISVFLNVVGNAPVPTVDNDYVQVSRDAWDAVLSYAQFLASFKMGGSDFTNAKDLETDFISMAAATNSHLQAMGIFSDVLDAQGHRQERVQERMVADNG
jgi:hypothetical protein